MRVAKPKIKVHDGIKVVRDDLLEGGTKVRSFSKVFPKLKKQGFKEVVYASPSFGAAQIALSFVARELGMKATVFVPAAKEPHDYTKHAKKLGAKIVMVPMGFQTTLEKRARDYCAKKPKTRYKLGFGGEDPESVKAIMKAAQSLKIRPKVVYTSISSGVLSRGLQAAWPTAKFFGVVVGHKPTPEQQGIATLVEAPEAYNKPAKVLPPFPSAPNYDAKVWQFILKRRKKDGVLFWNVYS